MKNKYVKLTHISERKGREVLKYFAEDFKVIQIAKLSNISHNHSTIPIVSPERF